MLLYRQDYYLIFWRGSAGETGTDNNNVFHNTCFSFGLHCKKWRLYYSVFEVQN
jgi:hypothetical protein